ncbi:hypothetical protein COLO4_15854 [Corchorus olitorius]|uniref:Uncharacterized protein n=1 Tax=Corchorus olitorius TaxID=93759 RepID=A0A1R3JL02_9ROSI|nr:hypothetical protein COLO4_15854 [Corchorus olitorius]
MAKFSGEGGAKQFSARDARVAVYNGLTWGAIPFTRNRELTIVDDGTLDQRDFAYLGPQMIRKKGLQKRKPTELTQEVLGTLETQRVVSGNNTMTVDNVSDETDKERHWKRTKTTKLRSHDLTVELFGDSSPAHSEASVSNSHDFNKLADQVGNSGTHHSSERIVPLERSIPHVDMPGMGETCENNVVKPHSKALPLSAPEFTKLDADKVIEDGQLQLALILWENVQLKIARTPFNQVHLLIEEVHKIFAAIEGIKAVDFSGLKGRVEEYFKQVAKFTDLESSFSSRMSSKDQADKLQTLKTQLEGFVLKENQAVIRHNKFTSELTKVEKEISALQEKKAKLESSLKENEKALEVIRTDVSHIQEEMASAESRPILSEADANALKVLEDLLKSSREDLKNLKWKP